MSLAFQMRTTTFANIAMSYAFQIQNKYRIPCNERTAFVDQCRVERTGEKSHFFLKAQYNGTTGSKETGNAAPGTQQPRIQIQIKIESDLTTGGVKCRRDRSKVPNGELCQRFFHAFKPLYSRQLFLPKDWIKSFHSSLERTLSRVNSHAEALLCRRLCKQVLHQSASSMR